ncbi:ABC transporter substrate-binding protein [Pseudonocardia abyssalis]|uniref:ABC transporter substrate-binding protein n=1 Tax=Pseudonocardia abyssalis TaxID=2792008 RepID=A0ABS6UV67_9PSEU|nr:ABC transporter substrate-binding protein [Pseudonocardia abyssalis]MBW0117144.1 ABC transporter substrate-binding protein [Pseudonocardia abyssalis]MBW0136067.1 ABC transporter substrate-binding protein [Pseudonocardia abyssalis]
MFHRLGPAVLAVLALAACGAPAAPAPAAAAVTVENCGRQVTLDAPPERVMVIGGEAGTLVAAAGGADRITTFAPLRGEPLGAAEAELAARPQAPIGTATDISREFVLGQTPDLVVTFGLEGTSPEELAELGIPTLIVAGYCGGFGAGQSQRSGSALEEVATDVEMIGTALGTSGVADAVADDLRARVEAVRSAAAPDGRSAVALFVSGPDSALGAYGNLGMVHEQLELVGLGNVFGAEAERYFEPSVEALIGTAPDVVLALHEPGDTTEQEVRESVLSRPELAGLPAVVNRDVLVLDFFRSGHGTLAVDGLEELTAQLATLP